MGHAHAYTHSLRLSCPTHAILAAIRRWARLCHFVSPPPSVTDPCAPLPPLPASGTCPSRMRLSWAAGPSITQRSGTARQEGRSAVRGEKGGSVFVRDGQR